MTGDLEALTRRGWDVNDAPALPDEPGAVQATGHGYLVFIEHDRGDTRATADRMTAHACLVAEGHDLVRLPHDATALRERILRALMGTSVPPVSTGAGQPTGPAGPEADAAALDTAAPAGTYLTRWPWQDTRASSCWTQPDRERHDAHPSEEAGA